MTTIINLGDRGATDSISAGGQGVNFTELNIDPGQTVNVAVTAGDTVSYFTSPDLGSAAGMIALNANQNFTTPPVYLASNTESTVTITGGDY